MNLHAGGITVNTSDNRNVESSYINVEAALAALDGQRDLLQDLALILVEDVGVLLDQIDAAVAADDALAVQRSVHKLKGLVSTFYAQHLTEACQRYEEQAASGKLAEIKAGGVEELRKYASLLVEALQKHAILPPATE